MKNYIIIGGNRGISEVVSSLLEQEANVHHFGGFLLRNQRPRFSLSPYKFDATKIGLI